jgi:hypothetical protein
MGNFLPSEDHLENAGENAINEEKGGLEVHPVLDKHGFPLVPQPTTHTDDPLVSEHARANT